jgi:hypothetical protein
MLFPLAGFGPGTLRVWGVALQRKPTVSSAQAAKSSAGLREHDRSANEGLDLHLEEEQPSGINRNEGTETPALGAQGRDGKERERP